jgi:hypothetical protein
MAKLPILLDARGTALSNIDILKEYKVGVGREMAAFEESHMWRCALSPH